MAGAGHSNRRYYQVPLPAGGRRLTEAQATIRSSARAARSTRAAFILQGLGGRGAAACRGQSIIQSVSRTWVGAAGPSKAACAAARHVTDAGGARGRRWPPRPGQHTQPSLGCPASLLLPGKAWRQRLQRRAVAGPIEPCLSTTLQSTRACPGAAPPPAGCSGRRCTHPWRRRRLNSAANEAQAGQPSSCSWVRPSQGGPAGRPPTQSPLVAHLFVACCGRTGWRDGEDELAVWAEGQRAGS